MDLLGFLNDKRFNIFFSFLLGIGLVCLIKPTCTDSSCNITKAPTDKEFEKYVYRMSGNKCYEFKSEIVDCPSSGTIEAFRECSIGSSKETFRDQFSRRNTPILRCE
jgi:hypothetical protein